LKSYFPQIAKTYLIGKAAKSFAQSLAGFPFVLCETLEKAVAQAAHDAAQDKHAEPVVLLSPACASYDQYKNFEARGEAFRSLVQSIT
jgi:UDP-N-acetylmuramoylalanine--D-glutamate ligase